jgi:hypothetical protein
MFPAWPFTLRSHKGHKIPHARTSFIQMFMIKHILRPGQCQVPHSPLTKMSSELLAAARSDDLSTIADSLMQWVLRRDSIVKIPGHVLLHASTGDAPPNLRSGPEDKAWQLLGHCLNNTRINNATVTAILLVLVV